MDVEPQPVASELALDHAQLVALVRRDPCPLVQPARRLDVTEHGGSSGLLTLRRHPRHASTRPDRLHASRSRRDRRCGRRAQRVDRSLRVVVPGTERTEEGSLRHFAESVRGRGVPSGGRGWCPHPGGTRPSRCLLRAAPPPRRPACGGAHARTATVGAAVRSSRHRGCGAPPLIGARTTATSTRSSASRSTSAFVGERTPPSTWGTPPIRTGRNTPGIAQDAAIASPTVASELASSTAAGVTGAYGGDEQRVGGPLVEQAAELHDRPRAVEHAEVQRRHREPGHRRRAHARARSGEPEADVADAIDHPPQVLAATQRRRARRPRGEVVRREAGTEQGAHDAAGRRTDHDIGGMPPVPAEIVLQRQERAHVEGDPGHPTAAEHEADPLHRSDVPVGRPAEPRRGGRVALASVHAGQRSISTQVVLPQPASSAPPRHDGLDDAETEAAVGPGRTQHRQVLGGVAHLDPHDLRRDRDAGVHREATVLGRVRHELARAPGACGPRELGAERLQTGPRRGRRRSRSRRAT